MPGESLAQDQTAVAPPPPTAESQVPKSTLNWETREGRSYVIPGVEIIGYLFLLNFYDRHARADKETYRTDGNTIWKHLTDSHWVIDDDQFSTNQFLHPYSGTIYYGLARSAGLNFWESFLYTAGGSFLWEIGGEKTLPSINDQIMTTFGGTFLGEPLFRMASLLLEYGGERPGFWRELGATLISPPTGFNRLVFGNRFDAIYPSHDPAIFTRFQVGGTITSSSQNVSSTVKEHGATGDIAFDYGLPGKPGYTYTRPFDYFSFHFTYLPRLWSRSLRARDPSPPWRYPFFIAWTGMRGGISLAAALAIPLSMPHRDVIIFLTFFVIFVTLVIQGLSLPLVIRWLRLLHDGVTEQGAFRRQDHDARISAAETVLARLNTLRSKAKASPEALKLVRHWYQDRLERLRRHRRSDPDTQPLSRQEGELLLDALAAERQHLLGLEQQGAITGQVLGSIGRDLDLEEMRIRNDMLRAEEQV